MDRGRQLKKVPPPLSFELRVDPKAKDAVRFPPLDLHNTTSRQALFSERLIACLADSGVDNIDYYDARVVYEPTKTPVAYRAANIIGIASVLDRSQSEFKATESGTIYELLKIVIDETKCQGQGMFRFKELSNMIVVSDPIKEALEARQITGIRIIRDAEWAPGMI